MMSAWLQRSIRRRSDRTAPSGISCTWMMHLRGAKTRGQDIVCDDRRVDVDEIAALDPAPGPHDRERKRGHAEGRQSLHVLTTKNPKRFDGNAGRVLLQQRPDRAGARQHHLDLGRGEGGSDRLNGFDEAPVGTVKLVTLVDACDQHRCLEPASRGAHSVRVARQLSHHILPIDDQAAAFHQHRKKAVPRQPRSAVRHASIRMDTSE